MSITITWTKKKLKVFEKKMNECVDDTFMFEGHEVVKAYAKYLVEYLKPQFKE